MARRLATARAEVAALRAMTYAGVSRTAATGVPGPEGSIVKLYFSEMQKSVARLAMDLIGSRGLQQLPLARTDGWSGRFLESFSYTIGGGTSEVQRNIIGDRVLGLPR